MNMISVISTNITAIGYEDNKLYIKFNSGQTYRYDGVPIALYNNLMSSASKGSFFAAFIKNKFPTFKV